MKDNKKKEELENEEIQNTAAEEETVAQAEDDTLEKKIAELEAKLKEADDKYLRMAAEYDNFRRRSREEKDALYGNAQADTIRELLPIIDNLERADGFDDADKVREGLLLISGSVKQVMEKLGIEAFGAAGEEFDPNIHSAIMHDENPDLPENVITDVFQKGYKKGGKIIRFAMVKTAN